MNNSVSKFLLSMLLAMGALDTPLNSEEKDRLKNAAQQLSLLSSHPTAWEKIELNLIEIISNNLSFNMVFQEIKSKLDKIDDIPENLIVSQDELAEVIPVPKNEEIPRPIPDVKPSDLKSNEITNMSIQILSSPEPSETVKKISKLEEIKDFISQNNSDNK